MGELSMPLSHIWHPVSTTEADEPVGLRFSVLTSHEEVVRLEIAGGGS